MGEYSEGVKRVEEAYKKAGIKDVTLKVYNEARHSLLQDLDRTQIYKDIYEWIEIVRLAKKELK